jgi:mRNA-degrading endonuclease RelE of RelBE toxin-antitoxin system
MALYSILLKKAVQKNIRKLPVSVQDRFEALVVALRDKGPAGPHGWANYSKLGENEYHCHITYRYVACWRHEKDTIIIEVYYAGSRENAPY